ncbi:MAG: tryptophan 2,3-dioxygenase family protein [Bacteroidota bacterium]
MPDATLDPWWDFALDAGDNPHLTDETGRPVVNPPDADGRLGLDYSSYLGLDLLLSAQVPASRVPDERVFVIIHQVFELVFKQMAFDLAVAARTCEALAALDEAEALGLATEPLPDERGPSAFWRPGLTAAARLRHSARVVLPAVMSLVGHGTDGDVLFSTLEYQRFRDLLTPASGFQTAQLRLIQRALGKGPLLDVPVFPGATYGANYTGAPCGHVALGDPLVLRSGHPRAFPDDDHPAHLVTRLDALAHAVLARLASEADGLPAPPTVRRILEEDLDRSAARVRATLGKAPDADAVAERFRRDLAAVAERENARRGGLVDARLGAHALHVRHPRTCLAFVLDRLASADAALHDPGAESFLTAHRKAVRRHVAGEGGTGGGGMPYLVTSQRFLLPLFPALVAYADLGAAGTAEAPDRW